MTSLEKLTTEYYDKVKNVLTKLTAQHKPKTLHNHRKDDSNMVLIADKRVVVVIIDKDMVQEMDGFT